MRVLKRVSSGASAAVLTLSSLMSLGITGVAHAAGPDYTCSWAANAPALNFNNAADWVCTGAAAGSVPGADNTKTYNLVFDGNNIASNVTLDDDLTTAGQASTLNIVWISFVNTGTTSHQFTIGSSTNKTLSTSEITASKSYPQINNDVILNFDAVVSSPTGGGSVYLGNLNLNGHNLAVGDGTNQVDLGLNGTLTGAGNVSVLSKANMNINSSPSASWAGTLSVAGSGTFGSVGAHALGADANTVTIASGGSLDLAGTDGATLPQNISVGGPAAINAYANGQTPGNVTLSGTVTLTSNTTIDGDSTITMSGPLHGSFTLTPNVGTNATLVISSTDDQSQTPVGTYTAPATTNTVNAGDNQPNVDVAVGNNVTEIIDGQRGYVEVDNGGLLQGNGQVSDLNAYQGGIVAPGHSPGKLTITNTLTLRGATYQAQLKDTSAGDFDQLVVGTAADTTGNDVTLGDTNGNPTLDVSLYDGFKIKAGDQFKIIDNQSGTAVKGTFNNLPEGATFDVNGYTFKISYVAGDGNDVVLTAVSVPKTPNTGFALVSAHPGATLGLTVLAAGTIFVLARNNKKLSAVKVRATQKRR